MDISTIVLILLAVLIIFIVTWIITDAVQTENLIKYYKKSFKSANLNLNESYLLTINNKQFIFQPIRITALGIVYYWTPIESGSTNMFRLTNMEELQTITFEIFNPEKIKS